MNDLQKKKYFTITYGCQMNENDSERMAGQLKELGFQEADKMEEADVIVINTCCVRESAEKKIYGKIGELKRLKTLNPNLIIGVAGCMAQKDRDKLFKKAPHIDIVLGTHNTHELKDLICQVESAGERVLAVWDQAERLAPDVPAIRKNKISAWVPIMHGCNNFCTYCIVPHVRGRERSRPPEEIVAEIGQLGNTGFKEITLLGQNVNSFGKDIDGYPDFADLLKLVDDVEGIERVRYMTSHPRDMNEKVIEVIRGSKKVCEHFHLPVQAGNNEILAKMNRGYTTEYYCDLVDKIRRAIPEASLTTDIIVGFPGESEELFLQTLEFIKAIKFDAAYTFLYSQRSGTPAAAMPGQVPLAAKKDRLSRLMQAQNEVSLAINKGLEGKSQQVLVEGESKNDADKLMGRTRTNKIMIWPKNGAERTGDLVEVKINSAQTWVLKGEFVKVL